MRLRGFKPHEVLPLKQVHHPPAFCPVHGLFPATAIALSEGVSNIGFVNVATNCPQCGGRSKIIPGIYDSTLNRLNVLTDPSISPQAFAAIRELVQRLEKGEISPQQAKTEAEKISPKLGKLFDIVNWSDQAKATLFGAIIGAVAIVSATRIASSPTQIVNVNPVIIERVVERKKSDLLSSSALKSSGAIPLPKPRPKRPR
jgi:hypothetical protein